MKTASALPIVFFLASLLTAQFSHAQSSGSAKETDAKEIELIRARLAKLEADQERAKLTQSPESEEIAKLKLGLDLPSPLGETYSGLGPAASRIYYSKNPTSLGGFLEANYFGGAEGGTHSTNVARVNLFFGSRITEYILFNSGFAFDNGGAVQGAGETRIDFAYADFILGERSGIRVGNMLLPVGVTNLRYEPTSYLMVNRPRAEELIIPSTWRENGLLGYWSKGELELQAGVFNAGTIASASPISWIRDGRQSGRQARAESAAGVIRVDWVAPVKVRAANQREGLGASIYSGSWAQTDANRFGYANVVLGEIHGLVRFSRFKFEGLYAEGRLSDTDRIYATTGQGFGSSTRGVTLVASWDLLPTLRENIELPEGQPKTTTYKSLPLFISWEQADRQAARESSVPENSLFKLDVLTAGFNYLPHEQVVIKTDLAFERTANGANSRRLEAALGMTF